MYVALWTLAGSHRTIPEATHVKFVLMSRNVIIMIVQSSLILQNENPRQEWYLPQLNEMMKYFEAVAS